MTTAVDRAQVLLTDLLSGGPREAAQILALAEDAKIALRTMQRAADQLGVIRTRATFRGGWIWRLPSPVEPKLQDTQPDRAAVIAQRLRDWEQRRGVTAPIHDLDPRLQRWVKAGISDPDLKEAYERAVSALHNKGPVTVGHLDGFVTEVIAEGAKT